MTMKDDSGDLFRRGLWFSSGCAALGAFLITQTVIGDFPHGVAWCMLVLSVFIAPGAIETGRWNVDVTLGGVSLGASVLGLLMFLGGVIKAGTMGDMLDLGPIFALIGFGSGTAFNVISLWDVLQELKEIAKAQGKQVEDEDGLPEGTPTRICPKCGKRIAAYAAACRYCKCILQKV